MRLALLAGLCISCVLEGCQSVKLQTPDVNNPILLGDRLNVGGKAEFEVTETGERYEGKSRQNTTVASSQYQTSTRKTWENSADSNAKWAFEGTMRRAVRNSVVKANFWVAYFLFVISNTEELTISGDLVSVRPPIDIDELGADDAVGSPSPDQPKDEVQE